MAYIEITGISGLNVTVRLNGLKPDYNQSIRKVQWLLKQGGTVSSLSQSIAKRITRSPTVTLYADKYNSSAVVECTISNITGSSDITLTKLIGADQFPSPYPPPSTPTGLRYTSTTTTIDVSWNSVSGADGYHVYFEGEYFSDASRTYTYMTGLTPNTRYEIKVRAYNDVGRSSFTTIYAYTKDDRDLELPKVSGLSIAQIKSGDNFNIKVSWSARDNVGVVEHWLFRSAPNIENYVPIGGYTSGSVRSYTFTSDANGNSFKGGNRYYFMIRAVDAANNASLQEDGKISIDVTKSRPENWEWKRTMTSGGTFYDTIGKTAYLMEASDWNDFTARIIAFRQYKTPASVPTMTTVSSSTSEVGIKNAINEAINAINPMLSTAQRMNTISAGDKVTAKIFTDFVEKIKLI